MDKSGLPPLTPYLTCVKKDSKISELDTGVLTAVPTDSITFISARTALEIVQAGNERLARKMDAAKFLDEAKRGLWDDPKVPSFQILKRSYDNQAFHFRDEKK